MLYLHLKCFNTTNIEAEPNTALRGYFQQLRGVKHDRMSSEDELLIGNSNEVMTPEIKNKHNWLEMEQKQPCENISIVYLVILKTEFLRQLITTGSFFLLSRSWHKFCWMCIVKSNFILFHQDYCCDDSERLEYTFTCIGFASPLGFVKMVLLNGFKQEKCIK